MKLVKCGKIVVASLCMMAALAGAAMPALAISPAGMTALLKTCMEKKSKTQSAYGRVESVADELLKFKQLLDMGAITEEEYNAKKSQLLEKSL